MKKVILSALFLLMTAILSNAQSIDSVSISFKKFRHDISEPWEFRRLQADSFSTGQLNSTSIQKWRNYSWEYDSLYKYIYTSSILDEVILQAWNVSQWDNSRRWSFLHTSSPDSSISQIWNAGWVNDSLKLVYSNSLGLDSLRLKQMWTGSQWQNLSQEMDSVAADSSLLSTTYYSSWNTSLQQWDLVHRDLMFYDSFGNDTAIVAQFLSVTGWVNSYAIFKQFLSNGLVSDESDYEWMDFDSAFSTISEHTTYTYDSAFNLIDYFVDGIPGGFGDVIFTYDSSNALINMFEHYESMGGISSELNTEWFNSSYPDSTIHLYLDVANTNLCSEDSARLNIFAFGGSSNLHFNWTPSSGLSSDIVVSPFIFTDTTTSYVITVSDDSSNSVTDTIHVTVNPSTIITNIQSSNTSCIGCSDGQFTVSISGGTQPYFFYIVPNNGAVITNNVISNIPAGIYEICVSDINSCDVCVMDTIFDGGISVPEINSMLVKIFPNPFSSHADLVLGKLQGNTTLELMDLLGNIVRHEHINSENHRIEKESLLVGTYIGVIRSEDRILARIKIIIL